MSDQPVKHHPVTLAWLRAANNVIKAHKHYLITADEMRAQLAELRKAFNHGVLTP